MPGIKRKAGLFSAKSPNGNAVKHKANGKSAVVVQNKSQDDQDDFDDDEDLMANALTGEEEEMNQDKDDGEAEDESSGEENGPNDVQMLSDEDLEGGFEDIGAQDYDVDEAGPSRTSGHHRSLYAIPSRDEMIALKNTSELYKSNIFRLKVSVRWSCILF